MENRINELEKKWDRRFACVLRYMGEEMGIRFKEDEEIREVIDITSIRTRKALKRHRKSIDVATAIAIVALAAALAAFIGVVDLSKTVANAFEQRQEISPPTLTTDGQLQAPAEIEQITATLQEQNDFSAAIPLTAEEQEWLRAAAEEFDVPYALALALVETETDFRNIAGDGGASIGYLQVNAAYHTPLMESLGGDDLWHPRDNFRTGLCYLSRQLNTCDTVHKALMAYNMGPTGAAKAWGKGIVESGYSCKVMARMERWGTILGGGA